MILTCPACHKRYLVDIRSLVTERIVRCATCNHTWRQTAIKEKSIIETDSHSLNEGSDPTVFAGPPLKSLKKRFSLGWILYGLTWGLIVIVSIIAREPLIISFPPLYKIYKNLGITSTPPGYGFKIENISTTKKQAQGKPLFTIQGEILNNSTQVKLLTPLHIVYKPPQNCQNLSKLVNTSSFKESTPSCKTIHWSFTLPQDRLLAGERIQFETTLPLPPSDFKGIIHF